VQPFFSDQAKRRPSGTMALTSSGARRIAEYALFYSALIIFGLSSLLWSFLAGALNILLPHRLRAPLGQFMIMAGFQCFVALMQIFGVFRCDIGALDALRCERGLVIASNHPSLLDAVLVLSRLPRVVCITKASLWDNWFLGGAVRLASYIRSDSPLRLVRLGIEELCGGHAVLIFPEGSRTVHAPIDPFKPGFALMAKVAGVPVQAVFIEASSPYLGKGWPLFRKPALPLVFRARLGARFEVKGEVHAFVAELEAYFDHELTAAADTHDHV
jgi:1-acyl-sn-glycerol-3-phosphate acyltransferase